MTTQRKQPTIVCENAVPGTNRFNPYDPLSAGERWAARAHLLGKTIQERFEEALGLKEIVMDGERYLTAREVWERLAISERHFFRIVRQKRIPCLRIGRVVRYKWSAVEAALTESPSA
jgi:excisionase family DNA binding protein